MTAQAGSPERSAPAQHAALLKLAPYCVALAAALLALFLAGWPSACLTLLGALAAMAVAQICQRRLDVLAEHRRRQLTLRFMQDSMNAIPMPIFVKNADGQLIMVNDAYCALHYLPRERLIGRRAGEFNNSARLAQIAETEDRQVLTGQTVRKEEEIAHPATGERMHRIVTKARSRSQDDEPLVIGTFYDITELRLSEERTREALQAQSQLRAFLQFIFDKLPNPLFVKDEQRRYIMTNLAHQAVTQLAAEDILGKRAADLLDAKTAAVLEHQEDEMLCGPDGVVYETELTMPHVKGGVRREILRKVVGRDAENKRVIIGMTIDITSLRHAEARWQFALEGAGDGLWDWDIAAHKVFYSPRWKAMQGFSEEAIGDSEAEGTRRMHPDDVDAARAALQMHLDGQAPVYICEMRQMTADGRYIWILDRGQIVERSPDGRPLRMIGIYTDITQQKQIEDELRRHRDSLKLMVEEQTTDLLRAKEAAERANYAKTQFLANMSHELRTPMHAVLSFARLGEEKAAHALQAGATTPEKLPVYFQRIRQSGDRLLSLLNDLLDLAKLEAGRMVLHKHPLDMAEVLREILHEFEASLLARRLTVVTQVDPAGAPLTADAGRIAQIVRNLLSNAIKFSFDGGTITVSLRSLPADNTSPASVELSVADQGPGIPESELQSVFDKFVQSSQTRSNAGGTGLGLPICREIAEAHGGWIFARSGPDGRGAELVLRLPQSPAADEADESMASHP